MSIRVLGVMVAGLAAVGIGAAFFLVTGSGPRLMTAHEEKVCIGGTGPYQYCGSTPVACPAACTGNTCAVGSGGCVQTAGGNTGCTASFANKHVCNSTISQWFFCNDNNNPTACGNPQMPVGCVTITNPDGTVGCQSLAPGCGALTSKMCGGC